MKIFLKGRGAQINTPNPFHNEIRSKNPLLFEEDWLEPEWPSQYIETKAKSIINKVESPDVPGEYSLNPYQGCEHGCVYCYARNTHTYWGYSAGLDFESKILVKINAAELLDKKLSSRNWKVSPIMLSGNTDCYQPAEKKYGITRQILETLWKHRHPAGIITKSTLIVRDLDILQKMAMHHLVSVAISINTLDDALRHKLEPRASSIPKRLALVRQLVNAGIPVTILAAPIIPGLNDQDIFPLVKKCAEAGASRIHHLVVRLNGDIAEIFKDWLEIHYKDRTSKVIHKIKDMHQGQLGSSTFGDRMKGSGLIAEMIHRQFEIAKRLYLIDSQPFEYNVKMYDYFKNKQLSLFGDGV